MLLIGTLLVLIGMIYFPTSLLRRPHPSFWKLIQGLQLCYAMVLVYTLCLTTEDVHRFLGEYIDASLGQPQPQKNYAIDCSLTPELIFASLYDKMDIFIIFHAIGLYIIMLTIRDVWLSLGVSILFEIFELSFRHWLPNFYECWWDHIVLDLIICNGLGIYLGHLTIKSFDMAIYRWTRISSEDQQPAGMMKRLSKFAKGF